MVAFNETEFPGTADAYGNTIIFTGPGPDNTWFTDDDAQATYGANSTIFCGYLYDPESLNYYVRNRFYAPHLGRWLTVDPIGYRAGKNLYEYCGGRPVTAIDPSGNWGWGWVGLGAAIVGVVAVGAAVATGAAFLAVHTARQLARDMASQRRCGKAYDAAVGGCKHGHACDRAFCECLAMLAYELCLRAAHGAWYGPVPEGRVDDECGHLR